MTRDQAESILNRAREGDPDVTGVDISKALFVTGDKDENPFKHTHRPIGSWERVGIAKRVAPASPWDALLC